MQNTQAYEETASLTIRDAADITGLSFDTLRRYSRNGRLPTYRTPGNHRRFRESDVRSLIAPVTPADVVAS